MVTIPDDNFITFSLERLEDNRALWKEKKYKYPFQCKTRLDGPRVASVIHILPKLGPFLRVPVEHVAMWGFQYELDCLAFVKCFPSYLID